MFDVVKHDCLSICSLILSAFLCVIFSIDVESQEVCNEQESYFLPTNCQHYYSILLNLLNTFFIIFFLNLNFNRTISGCCPGYFWSDKNNSCECKLELYISKKSECNYLLCLHYSFLPHRNKHQQLKCFTVVFLYICISVCMPGYTGINCTKICPYPSYGPRCQGFCDCNKDICDVSTGCEPNTTGRILVCL